MQNGDHESLSLKTPGYITSVWIKYITVCTALGIFGLKFPNLHNMSGICEYEK